VPGEKARLLSSLQKRGGFEDGGKVEGSMVGSYTEKFLMTSVGYRSSGSDEQRRKDFRVTNATSDILGATLDTKKLWLAARKRLTNPLQPEYQLPGWKDQDAEFFWQIHGRDKQAQKRK